MLYAPLQISYQPIITFVTMPLSTTTGLASELPDLVLLQIVELASGTSQVIYSRHSAALHPPPYALLPFLSICQQWRRAILPHFYSRACLCVCRHSVSNMHRVPALQNISHVVKLGHACYVRRLLICLSRDAAAEGTLLHSLKTMLVPGMLPGVLEVALNLDGPSWDCRIAAGKIQAAAADTLVQIIRNAAPNARSVAVGSRGRMRDMLATDLPYLVQSLVRGTRELRLLAPPFVLRRLARQSTFEHGLADITVGRSVLWSDDLVKFIRNHAATLQVLKLERVSVDMFHRLLCGNRHESQHIYPNISRLELAVSTMSVLCESSYELPPFPALTHFINHHSHPFSDDTILRCNRKRLESVKLPLSVSQFEAMLAKGAFDQGHYAKLADIAVSLDGVLPTSEPGNILVRLFVSACSMSAMSERIRVAMCNTDITLALAKLKPIPALRELACPQLKLGASQLLPLLARFPGIRRIGYCFAECASDAVSASPSDQEIQDQWLLCSSRSSLVSMELFDTGHTCGPQCIGQAVILLASLLPNLREITVRPHTKVNARALLQNLVQAQQREVYRQRPHVDALKISIVSRAHRFNN